MFDESNFGQHFIDSSLAYNVGATNSADLLEQVSLLGYGASFRITTKHLPKVVRHLFEDDGNMKSVLKQRRRFAVAGTKSKKEYEK